MRLVTFVPPYLEKLIDFSIDKLKVAGWRRGSRFPHQARMFTRLERVWWGRQDLPSEKETTGYGKSLSHSKLAYSRPPSVFNRVLKKSHTKLLTILFRLIKNDVRYAKFDRENRTEYLRNIIQDAGSRNQRFLTRATRTRLVSFGRGRFYTRAGHTTTAVQH
jgi:hypothetical protein